MRENERETEAFLTINLPLKSSVLQWTIRRLKTKKKEREVHRSNVKQPPRTMWIDQDGVERGLCLWTRWDVRLAISDEPFM